MKFPGLTSLLLLQAAHRAVCSFSEECTALAQNLSLPDTVVWFTESIDAGTNITFSENDPSCNRPHVVVSADFCRVAMSVTTSPTSEISLEAWLPRQWTGRFLSTGNGGLSGCIQYEDLGYTVAQGFATVGANNGHNGTSGESFDENPEGLKDFVYRSVHTGAVIGKQVTKAFYGLGHTTSYYLGCSTGGRQGFKEAQDFPEDFDGIIAGAPAVEFSKMGSWIWNLYEITGPPDSPTFLEPELWAVVYEDILKHCDDLDGHVDGIIENPSFCSYEPDELVCSMNQTKNCLTETQADTVRSVFSPLSFPNGTFIFPGLQYGADSTELYFTGSPNPDIVGWFRYVVYGGEEWDPSTLGPKDYAAAIEQNPYNIATFEGDLSSVRERGTKILHYHGLQDNFLSSGISPLYYDHVSETMDLSPCELDEFYRFFQISGMGHCYDGTGAGFIGSSPFNVADYEPESNVVSAMVRWVEEGIAPDTILGTAYADGTGESGEVAYKRRHCRYPASNFYSGIGDPADPDSWQCI